MNYGFPLYPGEADEEVLQLIETLVETGKRLEALTGGEIDSVTDRQGRSFLLQHAQEKLRDSEDARQAAILNVLPAHIALLDSRGAIISINEAWRRSQGGSRAHAPGPGIGANYIEMCESAEGAGSLESHQIAAGIRSVLGGVTDSFSKEYSCEAGTGRLWFQMTAIPLSLDRLKRVVVTHLNVTEQKRAKEELRESERRFSDMLANVDLLSLMLDREGRITYCNDYLLRLTGWQREEVIGRDWFELFIPDRREPVRQAFYTLLADPAAIAHYEVEILTRSGEKRLIRWNNTVLRSVAGEVIGSASIGADITEEWRLQQQLRTESQRAESAKLAKDRFLAAVSHELRTPMNAILGMADLLCDTKLTGDQMHYVEVFKRAGSNLLALINEILDLSKIEAGYLELESVEFDLEDVVDQTIELMAVKARAKNLRLSCRLAPGLTTQLIGDPTRLRQILINLLGNAVKFTDRGEVVLTVQNQASGEPGAIEFSVSDTGAGIAPEKLGTIFDDFTQADPSITRKYGGTGLGLGISRRLIEKMGGLATVTSSMGVGSTFRFSAHFKPGMANPRKPRSEMEKLNGRRVLLIEEGATDRSILAETLRSWELEVRLFQSPAEALAVLAAMRGERPLSLAVVGECFPEMDSLEVCVGIRRIASDLPVVLLASDTRPCDAESRQRAGLSGFAIKPVKRSDLLRLTVDALTSVNGVEPPPAPAGARPLPGSGPPVRVLVVEDWPDNLLLMRAYLHGTPHRLTMVEDGEIAVKRFLDEEFDLILMDVQMPVMDGLTATRAIREIEKKRGSASVPIIALSANARPEDVEMSRNAGCDGHVSKPISKLRLLEVIEKHARV